MSKVWNEYSEDQTTGENQNELFAYVRTDCGGLCLKRLQSNKMNSSKVSKTKARSSSGIKSEVAAQLYLSLKADVVPKE